VDACPFSEILLAFSQKTPAWVRRVRSAAMRVLGYTVDMKLFSSVSAALASMAFLTGTAGAVGQPPGDLMTYHTAFVQQSPNGAGQIEGTMHLRIAADGKIQGDYRPGGGRLFDVVGGLTGEKIWLNIGYTRVIHLTGTYENGKIVGYTYIDEPNAAVLPNVPRIYEFDATPEASPPEV